MAMNYERVSQRLTETEAEKYSTGIGMVNDLVNSLKGKNLLPEKFSEIEVLPKADELQSTREEELQRRFKDALGIFERCSNSFLIGRRPNTNRIRMD